MARKLADDEIASLQQLADTLRGWQPDIPLDRFEGRGIVIAAGGATIFTNAYVLVSLLRNTLNCQLPIEVWHLGPAEMSASMAALLEAQDVTVVDAEPMIDRHGDMVRDGWQLKPFAMLWSRFAEVLLLDADQVPVIDPAACFDWPEYRTFGAVFWPDVVDLLPSNPVWPALGLSGRAVRSLESGQVLVDKQKCLRALAITVRLNAAADLLYQLIYGDKDTFLLGWELAAQPFAVVPHRPFRDERILVQRDFGGAPLFQHRTGAKWQYGGVQYRIENFVHEAACLDTLDHLHRRWGGRVFHAPDRSIAARRAEAELIAGGPIGLEIGLDERLTIELLPFGEIGEGRSLDRETWWCDERAAKIVLNFGRPGSVTYRFDYVGDGYWTGQRLRPPPVPARLVSAAVETIDPAGAVGLADALVRAARLEGPEPEEAAFGETLQLLMRVEPSILARLRSIAPTLPDAARASVERVLGRLEPVADSGPQPVRSDIGILAAGYTRDINDGPD